MQHIAEKSLNGFSILFLCILKKVCSASWCGSLVCRTLMFWRSPFLLHVRKERWVLEMSRVLLSDSVTVLLPAGCEGALCFLTPGRAPTTLYAGVRAPPPLCSALHRRWGRAGEEGEPVPQCLSGAEATASAPVQEKPLLPPPHS